MTLASGSSRDRRRSGVRRALPWLMTAAALGLAAYLLQRIFRQYSWDELRMSVAALPAANLAMAGAFAGASYLCLTIFDLLALRSVGHRLPYRKAALASFAALSIGHTVGLAVFSSGAIRYRFYSGWGLKAADIARIILFCALTAGLGLATLAATALLVAPDFGMRLTGFGRGIVLALGGIGALLPLLYLGLCATGRGTLRFRRWSIELPPLRLAVGQVVIGPVNFACVAGCLYQALAAAAEVSYPEVLAVYVIANVTGLLLHVPGGLGVIESIVLALVPGTNVIGALLVFRAVYFLIPFILGCLLLAATELARRRQAAA